MTKEECDNSEVVEQLVTMEMLLKLQQDMKVEQQEFLFDIVSFAVDIDLYLKNFIANYNHFSNDENVVLQNIARYIGMPKDILYKGFL